MAANPQVVYELARELATDALAFVSEYAEEWDGGDKGYIGGALYDKADELLRALEHGDDAA